MLQLSGARLALKAGENEEALAALEDAEAAGRSAMAEIHRTVGLLETSGAEGAQSATPSAADLPRLVADFRRAGLTVDFHLEGDLASVPMATGLAAFRVVQESLSNAVKHAPGAPVRLRVRVTSEDIVVSVVNPVVVGAAPRLPAGGNGLRGMSERAELLGGMAAAGNGDGTWKVDARLPLGAPPA
jgi:signal transduction histidine kinase